MTLDLEPIRARLAAATPGPWHAYGNTLAAELGRCTCSPHYGAHERSCGLEDIGQVVERDADLIANAPSDLAALVAEVERLRETMQRVREMHSPAKWYDDFCDDPECDQPVRIVADPAPAVVDLVSALRASVEAARARREAWRATRAEAEADWCAAMTKETP